MKKAVILNFCIILLIFLTAGMHENTQNDLQSVQHLLEERIAILNHYYGNKMSFADARKNVENILAAQLLKEDLAQMKAYDQTTSAKNLDQVADFAVEMISCQRNSYGMLHGQTHIYWVMQGENGRWESDQRYYYTAEDNHGTIKLTQLKKI